MNPHSYTKSKHFFRILRKSEHFPSLFSETWDHNHFLNLMIQHLLPETQPLAYCILINSYDILLYIPRCENIEEVKRNYVMPMESGYQMYLNKKHNKKRDGVPVLSGEVTIVSPEKIKQTICQIHQKPVIYQYCDHPVQWHYSSYASILRRESLLIDPFLSSNLFGGIRNMKEAHRHHKIESEITILTG